MTVFKTVGHAVQDTVTAALLLVAGTIIFMFLEGFSPVDSFYFCFITLATIGYGDLHPTTDLGSAATISVDTSSNPVTAVTVTSGHGRQEFIFTLTTPISITTSPWPWVTASAIGRDLNLGPGAVSGAEFRNMTDDEVMESLDEIHVLGRVTPEDKLRLVQLMQADGMIVAMTGDAVNDAAALKQADIGVAMGSGSEVTKQAAKMILTDDNFGTLVHAVRLGRSIYKKVALYVRYQMSQLLSLVILFLGTNDFQSMHANKAWHSAQGISALISAIKRAPIEPDMPEPVDLHYEMVRGALDAGAAVVTDVIVGDEAVAYGGFNPGHPDAAGPAQGVAGDIPPLHF